MAWVPSIRRAWVAASPSCPVLVTVGGQTRQATGQAGNCHLAWSSAMVDPVQSEIEGPMPLSGLLPEPMTSPLAATQASAPRPSETESLVHSQDAHSHTYQHNGKAKDNIYIYTYQRMKKRKYKYSHTYRPSRHTFVRERFFTTRPCPGSCRAEAGERDCHGAGCGLPLPRAGLL